MPSASRAPFRQTLLVIIAAAALYLVGNDAVGLFDRDEPRYAQTSQQMLVSDPPDWVVPRLLDEVRTAKPILIYWCQAMSMKLLGSTSPFAARFPSVVAMLLTLVVLAAVLSRAVGPLRAFWTVFIFATSALVIAAAKMCIIDSLLLLWIVVAQLCLAALYVGRHDWSIVLILWGAFGVAVLAKGPVVLVVLLSTMFVLCALDVGGNWRSRAAWLESIRWWRRTRPLIGLLIVIAVVSPWLVTLHVRQPDFLPTTLKHDVLTRTMKPLEGHNGPPGYYLLTVWATYFPWCLFLPVALVVAWKHRRLAPIRFALAAAMGPWLVMEFVQTKLPHYVLPAFPALAFLTADALVRAIRGQHDDLARPAFRIGAAVWAVIVALTGFLPWLMVRLFPATPLLCYVMTIISIAGIVYAIVVFVLIRKRHLASAAGAMGAGMIFVITVFYALYLPNAAYLWIPERVAKVLIEHGATRKGEVFALDVREDSLPYYQGGTLRFHLVKDLPDDVKDWPRFLVVTREAWEKMSRRLTSNYEPVGEPVRGLLYADDHRVVDVLVVRKRS